MARSYAACFQAVAVTAAQDIWEVVAPAAGTIKVAALLIGQSSDYGDAAAEGLQLDVIRGHGTSGSGGSSVTPTPMNASDAASGATVERNNTTVATTGTPVYLLSDDINIQAGYQMVFMPEFMPTVRNSERLVIRITAPADSLTVSSTIYLIEE